MLKGVLPIYRKEMLDMMRDRRTLLSMVVVPIVAMPLLFLVMSKVIQQVEQKAGAEAVTVAVQNAARVPGLLNALAAAKVQPVERGGVREAVVRKEISVAVEPVDSPDGLVLKVYADESKPAAGMAASRVRGALEALKQTTIRLRLAELRVPQEVLTPFKVEKEDPMPKKKMAGQVWGGLLGYIVVLLMFTGGMYPAIDLTAGEKERRTLEVLLSAPAGRGEIILAKLLATTTAVFGTAALTLISVFISFRYMRFGKGSDRMTEMLGALPTDPVTISLVVLVLLPTAVMGASLLIAIAMFAKSFKEAQSYLTPVIMAVIFPLIIGLMPGVRLTPALSMMPIFNSCQLIKEIFQGEYSMLAFAVTMGANILYAAIAFFAAVRTFSSEKVLFRT